MKRTEESKGNLNRSKRFLTGSTEHIQVGQIPTESRYVPVQESYNAFRKVICAPGEQATLGPRGWELAGKNSRRQAATLATNRGYRARGMVEKHVYRALLFDVPIDLQDGATFALCFSEEQSYGHSLCS